MATFLALIIVGWLVAFALGSQAGFDNEPTAVAAQSSVAQTGKVEPATYREPVSAA